jgi:hypothetical protein
MTAQLGDECRDRMTGIEGIYIALETWFDRSAQVAIQRPGLDADGKPFELHWFPQSRLEPVA